MTVLSTFLFGPHSGSTCFHFQIGCLDEENFGDPPSSEFGPLTDRDERATHCPETHFQCPDNGYCLPVFLRCNGVYDCPGKEDEGRCGDYTCPGYYRCRGSSVCVHPFYVCDGNFQCPQKDDELLCGMSCPQQCVCRGLAFTCTHTFEASVYPEIRYLDASGSGVTPVHLSTNTMLVHLDLSHCGLHSVGVLSFPNLVSLDLSDNHLTGIDTSQLHRCGNLRRLTLSRNPIEDLFSRQSLLSPRLDSLKFLDMSHVRLSEIDTNNFQLFENIVELNLSSSGLKLAGFGFNHVQHLQRLDMRGCHIISFHTEMFQNLSELDTVFVDAYQLCCPQVLPVGFNVKNCHGPDDVASSCDSLLGSALYRAFFAILAVSILLSDIFVIVVWCLVVKDRHSTRFYVYLINMAGCDAFMGIHTAIVTIADQVYRGHYLSKDTAWRHSALCQLSGFVFFLSTVLSAGLSCLMTLDRCAALRCPHRLGRVTTRATHTCCLVLWGVCAVLAAVSLAPSRELSSQTGVCQPLPALLTQPSNHHYILGTLIVVTSGLLAVASVGQVFVSILLRQQGSILTLLKAGCAESSELILTRRVRTFLLFDVACWWWFCVCMTLTSAGVAVSSPVQVSTSLLLLPLKAALNPCMYLIGCVLEHQRQTQRKRLFQRLGVTKQVWKT